MSGTGHTSAWPPSAIQGMTTPEFELLSTWIRKTVGIDLPPAKRMLLTARLTPRLRALRLRTFTDYMHQARQDEEETTTLIDCITTNETSFFREKPTVRPFGRANPHVVARAGSEGDSIEERACLERRLRDR